VRAQPGCAQTASDMVAPSPRGALGGTGESWTPSARRHTRLAGEHLAPMQDGRSIVSSALFRESRGRTPQRAAVGGGDSTPTCAGSYSCCSSFELHRQSELR